MPWHRPLIGINSRDLATFTVDLLDPVGLLPRVPWKQRAVFESGIRAAEDVLLARSAGFDGVLVGETAMRMPQMIPELARALRSRPGRFWPRLWARRVPGRPLVKVCGITRGSDAEAARAARRRRAGVRPCAVEAPGGAVTPAASLRAWTFSRWPSWSPGTTGARGISTPLSGAPCPGPRRCRPVPRRRDTGRVRGDGISRTSRQCGPRPDDVQAMPPTAARGSWPTPGLPAPPGGTGSRIPAELAQGAAKAGPLWLAGGHRPENIGEILDGAAPGADRRLQRAGGITRKEGPGTAESLLRGDTES